MYWAPANGIILPRLLAAIMIARGKVLQYVIVIQWYVTHSLAISIPSEPSSTTATATKKKQSSTLAQASIQYPSAFPQSSYPWALRQPVWLRGTSKEAQLLCQSLNLHVSTRNADAKTQSQAVIECCIMLSPSNRVFNESQMP